MTRAKRHATPRLVQASAVLLVLGGAWACGATGHSAQGPSSASRQRNEPGLASPNGPSKAANSRSEGAAETMPLGDAWDASSTTPSTVNIFGTPVPSF